MTTPYTIPELVSKNKNDWYIYFTYELNGVKIPVKRRDGINRIKDLKQREIEGQALAKARLTWLQAGWNPITDPKFKARNIRTQAQASQMGFPIALQWALNQKKVAKKTRNGYQSILDHIVETCNKEGFSAIPIAAVKRFDIMSLLGKLDEDRSFSNHGYNKYRDVIRLLLGELLIWNVIEYNPASKIPDRIVVESDKFQPYTDEEKQRIAEHLAAKHPNYLRYLLLIYHTGIRPKEALALKVKDISLTSREIKLVPDLEEENTKTKQIRNVPINDELLCILQELELEKFSADYYVFGSPFGPGGNRGSVKGGKRTGIMGAMRPDYFLPSPNRVKRDTVTRLWKVIIIEELEIPKYQYGMKYSGGDDKILAGCDLDALRSMYGHTSKRMTEKYLKKIKQIYKKEIITKSPAFLAPRVLDESELSKE